jgi:hypothetical protein
LLRISIDLRSVLIDQGAGRDFLFIQAMGYQIQGLFYKEKSVRFERANSSRLYLSRAIPLREQTLGGDFTIAVSKYDIPSLRHTVNGETAKRGLSDSGQPRITTDF